MAKSRLDPRLPIGRTGFDNNSPQAALQNQEEGFFDPVLTPIPSYSYLDLPAIWDVTRHAQLSPLLRREPWSPFFPEDFPKSKTTVRFR